MIPSLAMGDGKSDEKNMSLRAASVLFSGAAEAYSIKHTRTPIPYLGLGHFTQKKRRQGLAHLSAQSALWLARRHYANRVGTRDLQAFPNRTTESTFFPHRSRGYSETQFKYRIYADLAGHSLFYTRLIDLYSFYKTLHAKTAPENRVRIN